MIYLDYQATTPVAPEVAAAMRPWIEEKFANPHSPVALGPRGRGGDRGRARPGRARARPRGRPLRLHPRRDRGAQLGAQGHVRARPSGRKLVTVATEHAAVLDTAEWLEGQGVEVVRLPVGADGLVDLDMAEAAIDERTAHGRGDAGQQ